MQGAWVQSLVGEQRSQMLHGVTKKREKEVKISQGSWEAEQKVEEAVNGKIHWQKKRAICWVGDRQKDKAQTATVHNTETRTERQRLVGRWEVRIGNGKWHRRISKGTEENQKKEDVGAEQWNKHSKKRTRKKREHIDRGKNIERGQRERGIVRYPHQRVIKTKAQRGKMTNRDKEKLQQLEVSTGRK